MNATRTLITSFKPGNPMLTFVWIDRFGSLDRLPLRCLPTEANGLMGGTKWKSLEPPMIDPFLLSIPLPLPDLIGTSGSAVADLVREIGVGGRRDELGLAYRLPGVRPPTPDTAGDVSNEYVG